MNDTNDSKDLTALPKIGASAAAEYGKRAYRYLTEAAAFEVDSPQMAEMAAEDLRRIKAFAKEVDEERKSITRKLDEAKASIMNLFRPAMDYLAEAESTLKSSLTKYLNAEEKKRREEEVIKRKDVEAAAAKMRAEAAILAKQGEADSARALSQQADMLPALAQPDTERTKLAGVASSDAWKFEVIDSTKIPREFLMIDEAKIRKVVAALKSECNIAGIRVFSVRQLSARAER